MKGYVYVLTNEHMPGLVKIGRTNGDPSARAQQLYHTGVPSPFKVAHSVMSPDCVELEGVIHGRLSDDRVSSGREFFFTSVKNAVSTLKSLHEEQIYNWVNDFMPFHSLVEAEVMVDPSLIYCIAREMGERPEIIATAMAGITADELRPVVARFLSRVQRIEDGGANG